MEVIRIITELNRQATEVQLHRFKSIPAEVLLELVEERTFTANSESNTIAIDAEPSALNLLHAHFHVVKKMIGFDLVFKAPDVVGDLILFMNYDVDFIAVHLPTQEVFLVSHETMERQLFCSDSFSRFLESMIPHSAFFWESLYEEKQMRKPREQVVKDCCVQASKDEARCREFYQLINS